MLHIIICEDNAKHRARIETVVNKHLLSDDFNMDIALSVDNPATLLSFIETHQIRGGLYFLDIELQSDINGIELAVEIKDRDVSATIVFITTHSEMMHYTFRLKVEAMEYIVKDSPPEEIERRIIECTDTAYQRFIEGKHAKSKYYIAKVGTQILNILYDDILFFESSTEQRHKLILHKKNGTLAFRGHITGVSKIGFPFCMCHKSYVVNVNHVKQVDKSNRECEMIDGSIIPISVRKITEFLKYMEMSVHI